MFDYYETPKVRQFCHQVKKGSPAAVRAVAESLAVRINSNDIITPTPNRHGKPGVMLAVCEHISKITGCTVWDGVRGNARRSQYEAKKQGSGLELDDLGFYLKSQPPMAEGEHLIIDTIQDTGVTLQAVLTLLPSAVPNPFAVIDKEAEKNANALFENAVSLGDDFIVGAVSDISSPRTAFAYAYRAISCRPELEGALSDSLKRQFPSTDHAGLRDGLKHGFAKTFNLIERPPISSKQQNEVKAIASKFSLSVENHGAGFRFEEGGSWGFASALCDHFVSKGVPARVAYIQGFSHCYVDVGGQLLDHHGLGERPDENLQYMNSGNLLNIAESQGVSPHDFLSDISWAKEIIADAVDMVETEVSPAGAVYPLAKMIKRK
jgi:hypothetical protein